MKTPFAQLYQVYLAFLTTAGRNPTSESVIVSGWHDYLVTTGWTAAEWQAEIVRVRAVYLAQEALQAQGLTQEETEHMLGVCN